MATGTIKKVVADRGFGFISADDGKEYFFHRGALDTSLEFDRLAGGEPRADAIDGAFAERFEFEIVFVFVHRPAPRLRAWRT